eukprot:12922588-Alexandrium_andersonii.AAC.1
MGEQLARCPDPRFKPLWVFSAGGGAEESVCREPCRRASDLRAPLTSRTGQRHSRPQGQPDLPRRLRGGRRGALQAARGRGEGAGG